MKLIIAVVAILSAGAKAECDFCTGGLTVAPSTDIPNTGGENCASLAESAPTLDADEYFCTDVTKLAEAICCPVTDTPTGPPTVDTQDDAQDTMIEEDDNSSPETPDETPCPVCPFGLTIDADTIIPYPEANGASCGDLMGYAAQENEGTDLCMQMLDAEAICCPTAVNEQAPVNNPCEICANGGITVDSNLEIDTDGTTCGGLVEDATNFETDSDVCTMMKGDEAICCPAPPVNPCQVCAGGVTVDDGAVAPDGRSCEEVVADAENLEESGETCLLLQLSEATCCPAAVTLEDSCSVCSGGLSVEEDTSLGGGRTCGGLMEDALDVEDTSDECDSMKGVEGTCCPAPLENPCGVCADGLTVGEEVELGRGNTCGGLIVDALTIEEGSEDCDAMKGAESTCCPAPIENPCAVCADGLSVEESVELGAGRTCGGLIVDALTIEEGSDDCSDVKGAEDICCPAPLENPCSVCANGLTVDEEVELGRGRTCGGMMTDALTFEEESEECSDVKETESTCCPAPAENPCGVCADGLRVEESVELERGRTCGDMMTEKLTIEEESEECDAIKEAEAICCSDLAAEPCAVCADGLTVDENVAVMEGQTCGELLVDALGVEESSDECSIMKGAEQTCCPPELVDEPCSVCSDGLTVDDSVDLGAGRTCGGLVVDALSVEEDSDDCNAMKGAESTCCPTLAEAPCSVCPNGLTVDESVDLGAGRTCGGLIVDALSVEEDSDDCNAMKGVEDICCPPGLSSAPTATQSSSPTAAVPQTSSPQASSTTPVPTLGESISTSAPIAAVIESSAPTVTSVPTVPVADLTPGASTPAPVVKTTPSPVAITQTSSPTTSSPVKGKMPTYNPSVAKTENPNASKDVIAGPVVKEPVAPPEPPSESSCLVGSGFLTFVLSSIVYAMVLM